MASAPPIVSAVVPVYNGARYIGHTLRSLVQQTYRNLEIIVVDDGSIDATVALVQEMARLHPHIRLLRQSNSGVAAARNRGIENSQGDFIAPVDADDIWFPEAVERFVDCLIRSGPEVGVVYGWSVTLDENGALDGGFRCSMIEGDVFCTLLCHNFLGNASATMIRRTCLERYGGYDGQFRQRDAQGCEDWELYLRLAEHCKFRVVPEFLIGYRKPEGSMSSDVVSIARSHEYLLQTVCARQPKIPRMMCRVSRSSLYLYLAQVCHRQGASCESWGWMRRAFMQLPVLTLLRPGWYLLAAKNTTAAIGARMRADRRILGSDMVASPAGRPSGGRKVCLTDVSQRRVRIRLKNLAQSFLHRVLSRYRIT